MANATIIEHINQYIDALIGNLETPVVSNVNVIFDSGAVNGIFGIGAAMYLHKLEKAGRIKIDKISGCSIGSLIALWYSFNCPLSIIDDMNELFISYKKNQNFYHYEKTVKTIVNRLIKEEEEEKDIQTLNKRLYITYYDTKKIKKRIIPRYKNKQHLIDCILSSSHLPFLTSCAYKYKDRYIDGFTPHFFKKGKNLFINLIKLTQPSLMFSVKNEPHIYTRLLKGVNDMNLFFTTGGSGAKMCYYIDKKSYSIKLQLYIREYLFLFFFSLIALFLKIKKILPMSITQSLIYNKLGYDMNNEFKLLIKNNFF